MVLFFGNEVSMKTFEFVIMRIEQGDYDDIMDAMKNARHYCNNGETITAVVELKEDRHEKSSSRKSH